ncbi:hypothetical protein BDF21DRAFT_141290 [Thamnidium elegans]|nr:hypothetical protein BDF21DRAFT_141290 [Thamnidium elegans]
MGQVQVNTFDERVTLEREILEFITKLWKMDPEYTLGFVDDKNSLRAYCKDLTNAELQQLLDIVVDDYHLRI